MRWRESIPRAQSTRPTILSIRNQMDRSLDADIESTVNREELLPVMIGCNGTGVKVEGKVDDQPQKERKLSCWPRSLYKERPPLLNHIMQVVSEKLVDGRKQRTRRSRTKWDIAVCSVCWTSPSGGHNQNELDIGYIKEINNFLLLLGCHRPWLVSVVDPAEALKARQSLRRKVVLGLRVLSEAAVYLVLLLGYSEDGAEIYSKHRGLIALFDRFLVQNCEELGPLSNVGSPVVFVSLVVEELMKSLHVPSLEEEGPFFGDGPHLDPDSKGEHVAEEPYQKAAEDWSRDPPWYYHYKKYKHTHNEVEEEYSMRPIYTAQHSVDTRPDGLKARRGHRWDCVFYETW
ncbi:11514_t:CDS:2 [Acaulospora colombiana]|uniref:11514_t:CDS:1 n=1 Tax=Acaulospora colombiana TaxID=27376 RepID=A0ACA9NIF1_9GLOM|nr:11514_t:CDS:2 [Acaulospora colombiana]